MISEQELAVRKGEIILSLDEMTGVLSQKDAFIKYLNKTKASLLLANSLWQHRGKEEVNYNKADWITEIIASLEATENYLANYRKEQAEKEQKK